jgi:F-type H+-transporting ATPase subunit delta
VSADPRITGYARSLYAAAQAEGVLPKVEEELYAFAKALEVRTDLREALIDAAVPTERRTAVVGELLGGRAHPLTVAIVNFVIEAGRARDLGKIAEELSRFAASERQHVLAEVRSAVPVDEARRARLAEALSRATGRSVDVRLVVDPAVVGGVVARVGDEVFDGSLASRLEEARRQLGATR